MRYLVQIFLLLALILTLAACQAQPQAAAPTQPAFPRLRVTHNGGAPVDRLVIIFPESRVEFTDLEPGETSEYKDVPGGVYSYAAYETEIDGTLYEQPVIDWMGEQPVQGQDFTWLIDVEPNRGQWEVVQLVKATVDR